MQQLPYIQFDDNGNWAGRGMLYAAPDPAPAYPDGCVACTPDQYAAAGPWTTLVNGAIVIGTPPTPPVPVVYIPNFLVRQRLQDAGLWDQAVAAMTPAQQLEFATLQDGILPDDADVIALLTAIGAVAAEILALP